MAAAYALHTDEIARAKVFDPGGVERHHCETGLPVCSPPYRMSYQPRRQPVLLPMMTEREFRRHHEQVAARLRSTAASVTTSAMRDRIIEQAEEHERLAGRLAELDNKE